MKRKTISQQVPRGQIDWLLARVNVCTPDEEIAADFAHHATINNASPALIRAVVEYALKRHHKNLADYRAVMRGF